MSQPKFDRLKAIQQLKAQFPGNHPASWGRLPDKRLLEFIAEYFDEPRPCPACGQMLNRRLGTQRGTKCWPCFVCDTATCPAGHTEYRTFEDAQLADLARLSNVKRVKGKVEYPWQVEIALRSGAQVIRPAKGKTVKDALFAVLPNHLADLARRRTNLLEELAWHAFRAQAVPETIRDRLQDFPDLCNYLGVRLTQVNPTPGDPVGVKQ